MSLEYAQSARRQTAHLYCSALAHSQQDYLQEMQIFGKKCIYTFNLMLLLSVIMIKKLRFTNSDITLVCDDDQQTKAHKVRCYSCLCDDQQN